MKTDGRAASNTRSGRPSSAVRAALVLTFLAAVSVSLADEPAVRGRLLVKGKTLSYSRAWLVRGPDTSDATKASAYLFLASEDLSTALAACADIDCALWHTLREGAILQPLDDGHDSFWLRVLSPALAHEEQISGRHWVATTDRHDRLAGTLRFEYENTKDGADLEIDAPLIKEFPVRSQP